MEKIISATNIAIHEICPRQVYFRIQKKKPILNNRGIKGVIEHQKIEEIVKKNFEDIKPNPNFEGNVFSQELGIRVNPYALKELEMLLVGTNIRLLSQRLISTDLGMCATPDLIAMGKEKCIVVDYKGARRNYVRLSDLIQMSAEVMVVENELWPGLREGHLFYYRMNRDSIKKIYVSEKLRKRVLEIRDDIFFMQQSDTIPEYKETKFCKHCGYLTYCKEM